MDMYQAGNGSQQIKLAVDVATSGLAASRAVITYTGVPPLTVAHSFDATGDIPRTEMGAAGQMQGKTLRVATIIDLVGDPDENKLEAARINAKYFLDEGAAGPQTYEQPQKTVAADYSRVVLIKEIQLN